MDFSSEGLGGHSVHLREESGLPRDRELVTINMLPDDMLVEIFDFSENIQVVLPAWDGQNTWHALVHVCQRWRYLVFASPRRLNLRLVYRGNRPMSEVLDAWPVLPVSVISSSDESDRRWDNTVAALESEHYNRISEIKIHGIITYSRWKRFTAAMQKPFPELTHLQVWMVYEAPVLPDSFLGGSAPRLQTLELKTIPFPSIPKLLLSANHLVKLTLVHIPDSGYFSPDAIATALAVMTSLQFLRLRFYSPRSRPDPAGRPLPPPTRFVLPALTHLAFRGVYKYLEDLLARIDPPRLYHLDTIFFKALDFDVPQLHRLIGHADEFKTFHRATVSIYDGYIQLVLYPNTVEVDDGRRLKLQIECRQSDHRFVSLCQVCSLSFPLISALEELKIRERSSSHWKDDMGDAQWPELLDPFTALKNLYLTDGIAQHFCSALQALSGKRATEVLPALRNIFVEGSSLEPVQEAIKTFVTARRLSGHPVVVDHW